MQVRITESVSSTRGSGEEVTTVTLGGTKLGELLLVFLSVFCLVQSFGVKLLLSTENKKTQYEDEYLQ